MSWDSPNLLYAVREPYSGVVLFVLALTSQVSIKHATTVVIPLSLFISQYFVARFFCKNNKNKKDN